MPIVADAKAGLEALGSALRAVSYKSGYTGEIAAAREAWATELDRLFHVTVTNDFVPEVAGHLDDKLDEYAQVLGTRLTQTRVLGLLDELLEDEAIVVGSSGSLPGDLQRVWRPKTPDTYHMEYGYSCMGYEIAAAVGAKIASPDQPVYSMLGDGSYLMLHTELQTALQEGLKVTLLVFDNASFGCINNLQMGKGMGSFAQRIAIAIPRRVS